MDGMFNQTVMGSPFSSSEEETIEQFADPPPRLDGFGMGIGQEPSGDFTAAGFADEASPRAYPEDADQVSLSLSSSL